MLPFSLVSIEAFFLFPETTKAEIPFFSNFKSSDSRSSTSKIISDTPSPLCDKEFL